MIDREVEALDLKRVKHIFAEAVALNEPDRAHYLDQACGGDADLRAEVEAYLRAADSDAMLGNTRALPTAYVPLAERAGTVVGRYKLLQQIGEGGFGVVFMAEQEQPVRRRVALKIIKLGMDTRQVIARFEAERQALAMMDHPNVAKVFDGGATETGRPYFVMELVQGIPITEYCDRNKLSIGKRLELFAQVCQAVQHAHQKGLIHRDIKPSNVLVATVDERAVVKVIDFGIAKATQARLTEKTLFTEFKQLIGTPEYMSPEQAEGNLDIDTRSDVYSLGVLLYELLAGSTPFDPKELRSKAFAEMQRMIREVEPPKPSTRLSTQLETLPSVAAQRAIEPRRLTKMVRGELDWIVMKALEKDRTRRYESAAALAADLQHYVSDEPVAASPPSAAYRLRKLARRHRTALRVASAFVILLLAATVISSWQAVRATRAKSEALAQKQRADEQASIAEGMNQFFSEEVFGLADPDRFDRAGIRLVEALDAAASKIDSRFPKDTRLRAMIRRRFGQIYTGIDRPQQAIEQLQEALKLRRSLAGDTDPETLESRRDLGWAFYHAGHWSEAQAMLQATLDDQTKVLGGGHPQTLQTASYLTVVLMEMRGWRSRNLENDQRDLQVSRNAYREALAALGPRHVATLNAELCLASVLRWRYEADEAMPYAREAAIGLREAKGSDSMEAMWATYDYACCLMQTGHQEEAVVELEPLLASRYRVLGRSHIDSLVTAWRVAKTLFQLGHTARSLAVLEDVHAHLEDIAAARSWRRGQKLMDLGAVFASLGRHDRAAEFYSAACKMTGAPPGEETERSGYAHWLNELAWLLYRLPAQFRDDHQALELAKMTSSLSPNSRPWLLGIAYYRTGDSAQAVVELNKSVQSNSGGNVHEFFILAMAHWQLGHRDEARKCYDQAVLRMGKLQTDQDEDLPDLRAEAAGLLGIAAPASSITPATQP